MVTVTGGGFKGTGAFSGSRFVVDFALESPGPLDEMAKTGIVVRDASVEAVQYTTARLKDRIRDFVDSHFTGSDFTRNNRRRAANAIQARYYDELSDKGQYAGLVYSKLGRGSGPASFIDYLLLHMRGGTVTARNGQWLRIANPRLGGTAGSVAQTGRVDAVGSNVFFVKSRDGEKLYLLRKYGKGAPGSVRGTTQLIATLIKQVAIPASLSGLEALAAEREVVFDGAFNRALTRMGVN